jgi:hypothetical protein
MLSENVGTKYSLISCLHLHEVVARDFLLLFWIALSSKPSCFSSLLSACGIGRSGSGGGGGGSGGGSSDGVGDDGSGGDGDGVGSPRRILGS